MHFVYTFPFLCPCYCCEDRLSWGNPKEVCVTGVDEIRKWFFFRKKGELLKWQQLLVNGTSFAKSSYIFWTNTSFDTWWFTWSVQFIVWWSLFHHENANINTINTKATPMLCVVSDISGEAYNNSRNLTLDIWYVVVYSGRGNVILTPNY